jgi:hypothetical protein
MICVIPDAEGFPVIGPFCDMTEAGAFCARLSSWVAAEIRDIVPPDDWETIWTVDRCESVDEDLGEEDSDGVEPAIMDVG